MCSAVFPASYTFPTPTSVSGSSDDGNCANVSNFTSGTLKCTDSTSSVLFDDPRGMRTGWWHVGKSATHAQFRQQHLAVKSPLTFVMLL